MDAVFKFPDRSRGQRLAVTAQIIMLMRRTYVFARLFLMH